MRGARRGARQPRCTRYHNRFTEGRVRRRLSSTGAGNCQRTVLAQLHSLQVPGPWSGAAERGPVAHTTQLVHGCGVWGAAAPSHVGLHEGARRGGGRGGRGGARHVGPPLHPGQPLPLLLPLLLPQRVVAVLDGGRLVQDARLRLPATHHTGSATVTDPTDTLRFRDFHCLESTPTWRGRRGRGCLSFVGDSASRLNTPPLKSSEQ